ncbi:MAG: hypothetical protein NTX35_05760 [Verrucomicrobia bacterium]|nr:hypothetical protein [Verrucomicrobiota bacterium]
MAAFGTQCLWIVSLAFPLYAAGMCFEAAFNGSVVMNGTGTAHHDLVDLSERLVGYGVKMQRGVDGH